jgi:predicted deacylase
MSATNEPVTIPHRTFGTDDGPHLTISGGTHGDEWEPMAACRRLIAELERMTLKGRVTIAPVFNIPAFRLKQRTAEDGLDMARTCPGREDGSITERTAAAASKMILASDYYIDLHTGGTPMHILPLAGYGLIPNLEVREKGRAMAYAFGLPIIWATNARQHGRTLSVARDADIPSIYTELGGGGKMSHEGVNSYVEGCLNVASMLGIIEPRPEPPTPRYIVEDDRDESGHMQLMHPAPMDGFFEPAVELGDVLRKGEPLGHVVDELGDTRAAVPAAHDGTVLHLRCYPSVLKGDALGGMLPISEPSKVVFERGDPDS